MAATQNPNELRLEELQAIKAKIAAEEARLKAEIAAENAAEEDAIMNAKADARLIEQADAQAAAQADAQAAATAATAQGLTGERDKDGNLIPALDEQVFSGNIPTEEMIEQEIPVIPAKVQQVETDDIPVDVEVETDERPDVESDKRRFGGIDREEGRAESVESEARGEKPGWEMAEGGNTWSVNEKDDYWKTQEGYDEAVALYGKKPGWVKEPTLVYNPSTGEYEEVEEEEFEDLSRPTISAEVKKLFG